MFFCLTASQDRLGDKILEEPNQGVLQFSVWSCIFVMNHFKIHDMARSAGTEKRAKDRSSHYYSERGRKRTN